MSDLIDGEKLLWQIDTVVCGACRNNGGYNDKTRCNNCRVNSVIKLICDAPNIEKEEIKNDK